MNISVLVEISFWVSTLFFLVALYTIWPAFYFPVTSNLKNHLFGRIEKQHIKNRTQNTFNGFNKGFKYRYRKVGIWLSYQGDSHHDSDPMKLVKCKMATLNKGKNRETITHRNMAPKAIPTLAINLS